MASESIFGLNCDDSDKTSLGPTESSFGVSARNGSIKLNLILLSGAIDGDVH